MQRFAHTSLFIIRMPTSAYDIFKELVIQEIRFQLGSVTHGNRYVPAVLNTGPIFTLLLLLFISPLFYISLHCKQLTTQAQRPNQDTQRNWNEAYHRIHLNDSRTTMNRTRITFLALRPCLKERLFMTFPQKSPS